jgi:hypothetical protein
MSVYNSLLNFVLDLCSFKLTVFVFVVFLFPFQYNELLNCGRLVVFKNYTRLSSEFEFEVATLQMKGR